MPFDETSWRLPEVRARKYRGKKIDSITIDHPGAGEIIIESNRMIEKMIELIHQAEGLYDPAQEKDACGVGFIVHIDGSTSHQVLRDAEKLSGRWFFIIHHNAG